MKFIIESLRKLKNWMESFAEKPRALVAIFWLSLVESSVFPIPPDVLLIAIGVSQPKKVLQAAFWCTVGSIIGAVVGYYIGFAFMETIGNPIVQFYGKEDAMISFTNTFKEYGYVFLLAAAFTPIPYKVATIVSGATGMALFPFIAISSFGRAARFFLVAGLLYYFGPQIKDFIEKYFDKLSIIFLILLVGGFFALKLLM